MIKTISMYVSAEEAIDVAKQQNLSEKFDEKDYEYEKKGLEFNKQFFKHLEDKFEFNYSILFITT